MPTRRQLIYFSSSGNIQYEVSGTRRSNTQFYLFESFYVPLFSSVTRVETDRIIFRCRRCLQSRMEIFRSLKTFFYNHRRKFIISGIVVGGTVALFHYVRQQEEKRQKCQISEFLETMRRQRHFETIQITCDQTTISLGKRLEKRVLLLF